MSVHRVIPSFLILGLFLFLPQLSLSAENSKPEITMKQIEAFLEKVDAGNVYELVEALDNPLFREKAKATLLKIGAPATQPLIEKLQAADLQNAPVVIETLGMLGPAGKEAWPLLLQKSTSRDRDISVAIAETMEVLGEDVVPILIEGLEDPNSEIRSHSARLLSRLGPLADQAVPALRTRLRTRGERSSVRFWTLVALSKVGPAAEAALPELLKLLSTMEENERYLPAQALGSIGPPARAAVPQLVKMLKERSTVRNTDAATTALVSIGADAVPSVIEMLQDKSRNRRLVDTSSVMLVQIGKPAVPHLLRLLEVDDAEIVERAALVLLQIGEPAVSEMMARMQSTSNTDVQFTLAQILARIPSASAMAVPGLIAGIQDQDLMRRVAAGQALSEIGPPAFAAFPYLIQALQIDLKAAGQRHGEDFANAYITALGSALMAGGEAAILPLHQAMVHEHSTVRNVAVQAMASLGQRYKTIVVPRMVGSLMIDNDRLKQGALTALSGIEPGRFLLARLGHKAIPGLQVALLQGTPYLRLQAAQAMAMLGEPSVAPLVECLTNPNLEIRLVSVQSLGAMQARAEPAVPDLIKALNIKPEMKKYPDIPTHHWQEYAQHVALALGAIGGSAIPNLITVLQGDDQEMHAAAAIALSQMGKQAAPAVEQLRESIKHQNLEIRMAALAALYRIGPESKAALPELLTLLKERNSVYPGKSNTYFQRLRYTNAIVDVLGKLGKEGIPLLLPLLKEQDDDFRALICYALYKIDIKPEDGEFIDPAMQDQLISALEDDALVVRVVAAQALAAQGKQAEPAVDALIQAIRTSHEVIGDERFDKEIVSSYLPSIVSALDNIGEGAVEPLIQAAKEGNDILEGVAAWALFRIDPEASHLVSLGEGTIPVLINAIRNTRTGFTNVASEALIEMGDPAAKALLETIEENRFNYLHPVSLTLAKMHEASASVLIESLKDPNPFVRAAAARALGGPKPADPDSIPVSSVIEALTDALKDENAEVQSSAGHSLVWLDARLAKKLGVEITRVKMSNERTLLPREEDPLLNKSFD